MTPQAGPYRLEVMGEGETLGKHYITEGIWLKMLLVECELGEVIQLPRVTLKVREESEAGQ